MPFTANHKLKLGFLLLTLVPLLLGIVIWNNARELSTSTREVRQTQELLQRLESFLSRIKDVEVAQREYVLTGDESYVLEFRKARQDIEARLAVLSAVRSDQHWVELLRDLIPQKFEEIEKTIELRRSGDIQGAEYIVLGRRGQQPMDNIRSVIQGLAKDEQRLFDDYRDTQNRKLTNTAVMSAVLLLINSGLIWTLFIFIQRESRRTAVLNEELEARVQQRTLQLRKSNEELQQFAYTASHDLKEPMRMISSYATLLDRRLGNQIGPEAATWIRFIVDGVQRMNDLITDLLDYSRAGMMTPDQMTRVNVNEILDNVLKNLEASIQESGARVTYDALPAVVFEPVRMGQLLQNLISNGLKYRGTAPPLVHISAQTRVMEIEFSVRDNGIGIAPQYQEDIFGIFKRLHGKEVEGTGIGLATCKRIVEEHGGRIWVESTVGEGSTFRFTVPVRGAAVDYHKERVRNHDQRSTGHRGTAASGN